MSALWHCDNPDCELYKYPILDKLAPGDLVQDASGRMTRVVNRQCEACLGRMQGVSDPEVDTPEPPTPGI